MNLANCLIRRVLSPCLLCFLTGMAVGSVPFVPVPAVVQQDAVPQESRQSVERLFAALVRNPRFGTSFERVVRWHNQQGSLAALQAHAAGPWKFRSG